MAALPFVRQRLQIGRVSLKLQSFTGILKACTSKTQTVLIFTEAIIYRRALCYCCWCFTGSCFHFTKDKRLLRGFHRPSRWNNDSLLCQRIPMFTPCWIFFFPLPLSSGPVGGHQGRSPRKLEKQALMSISKNSSHIPTPKSYVVCLSHGRKPFMCLLTH